MSTPKWQAAVRYILGSGVWTGAEIIVDQKGFDTIKQRPGEWFTTFLVRAAREIARNLQDKDGMRQFREEYERCCEQTEEPR